MFTTNKVLKKLIVCGLLGLSSVSNADEFSESGNWDVLRLPVQRTGPFEEHTTFPACHLTVTRQRVISR